MTDQTAGMILSLCGMAVTVLSFQVKSKARLLAVQTAGSAFYLVSYIFSRGGIAVWLNAIYLVRNVFFMYFGERKSMRLYIAAGAFCACYLAAFAVFVSVSNISEADKLWNILPVCGAVFGTVAVTCKNVNVLRAWKIGDSCSWLAFNARLGLGALGGIIGEVLNLASIALGIFRFGGNKRRAERRDRQDGETPQSGGEKDGQDEKV